MLALKIVGIIVLLLILIMLIPVGVDFSYIDGNISLSALLCGIKLHILPKEEDKPKKEKKKKENNPDKKTESKKKKSKPEKKKKDKKPFKLCLSADEITGIIKKVFKGFGRLNFRIKKFLLHWIARGKDPYDTAFTFAKVNAVMSSLAPLCSEKFSYCDSDVWTDIDFESEKMTLDVAFSVVIRIGCFFRMINTILFGVLGIFIKNRVRLMWLKLTDRDYYEYLMEKTGLIGKIISKSKEKKANQEKDNYSEIKN